MINKLTSQRVLSIDAFRGITILVMIFVNELAGVSGIPAWMKHMKADQDAMSFVDVVFPAFLFIVGMSIPFALNYRLSKGDTPFQLFKHIASRTLGLLVLGVFMVNAEDGYNEEAMGMSIYLWSLLFYIAIILVWNVYTFKRKEWSYLLRGIGIAGLIVLALIYRGGDGSEPLQPHWWGILGLIGWAYLFSCIFYMVFRGNVIALIIMIGVCNAFYMVGQIPEVNQSPWLHWISYEVGNAAHTSITLAGVVLTLIYFNEGKSKTNSRRFIEASIFTISLLVVGYFLRPYYKISKIHATPTWCLYCSAICCIIYSALYWLIDLKGYRRWTFFFRPAGSNPLLTYIIPDIVFALEMYFGFSLVSEYFHQGLPGILWSAFYAVAVMWVVMGLNKLNIKLHL